MPTIPRKALDALTREVNGIGEDAQARVLKVLEAIEWTPGNIAECRAAVVDALLAVMPAYTDAAAQAGADFYDAVREVEVGEPIGAVAYSGFDPDAMEGAVRAFTQDVVDEKPLEQFNRKVLDRIDRDIRRAANMAVAENVRRDELKPKYARVPSGTETCSFCLMLASRGAVYRTPETASHAHPGCDCRIVPSFDGGYDIEGYDPDEIYDRWQNGLAPKIKGVAHSTEELNLPSGSGDPSFKLAMCDVYTTEDGRRFVFPKGIDETKQDMTPERAIRLYGRLPDNVKRHMQKTVFFVDYANSADEYWRSVYKNFTKSYATGGDVITFYAHVGHDDDYVVRTFCHEAGHYIDLLNSVGGRSYSYCDDWQQAMASDFKERGVRHPTEYSSNDDAEDFAESVAEYSTRGLQFRKDFPNRATLLDSLLT